MTRCLEHFPPAAGADAPRSFLFSISPSLPFSVFSGSAFHFLADPWEHLSSFLTFRFRGDIAVPHPFMLRSSYPRGRGG